MLFNKTNAIERYVMHDICLNSYKEVINIMCIILIPCIPVSLCYLLNINTMINLHYVK